jgi:hypothetical protein
MRKQNKIDKDVKLDYPDLITLDWAIAGQISNFETLLELNANKFESTDFFIKMFDQLNCLKMKIRPREKTLALPKDINTCEYPEGLIHTASFDYYAGMKYVELNHMKQSSDMGDTRKFTHYVVCCGDVMIRVLPEDFPEVERRPLNG